MFNYNPPFLSIKMNLVSSQPIVEKAKTILKEKFGYSSYRPLQEEIVKHALNGQDSLVIMPTGGGKSICFQLPALAMEGICLVISPLISLMRDQVEALKQNGINAAYLNSSLTMTAQRSIEERVLSGAIKLLYVSPEKLLTQDFFNIIKSVSLNLVAIDEAHCISQWGHDFRAEYAKLDFIKKQFPEVPVMALTATADKSTRADIAEQLSIPNAKVFLSSFDRPNLNLTVSPAQNRIKKIIDLIEKLPGQSGIVYCLSRKSTEQVAAKLVAHGIDADFYHAGMPADVRNSTQERFIKDDLKVVCATIAFGMGIDKSNVRWVVHYNLPKNIESYYQEIGRAGRDGLAAKTVLYYSYSDVMQLKSFIAGSSQEELLEAKLQRMQQFAEATTCRRKVLLSYFGEQLEADCGNCDVCRNPPEFIDGIELAQKAISASIRTNEHVGIGMLIDILRGSSRQELLQHGYQHIKTFGAGRAHSYFDWQHYIRQFLNLGLFEIEFDNHNFLKVSEAGKKAIYGKIPVQITRPESFTSQKEKVILQKPSKEARQSNELFERLKKLRKEIAGKQQVPAYIVFSDASLEEMSDKRPTTEEAFEDISGVGIHKLSKYGDQFIKEIISYVKDTVAQGEKVKGATHLITFEHYKEGMTPEQIAEKRNINVVTVVSHLVSLYEQGKKVDLNQYITLEEKNKVFKAIKTLAVDDKLKPLYDHFDGKIPYQILRIATSLYRK
jgi:ATP-dependent DNA helicase RecQ